MKQTKKTGMMQKMRSKLASALAAGAMASAGGAGLLIQEAQAQTTEAGEADQEQRIYDLQQQVLQLQREVANLKADKEAAQRLREKAEALQEQYALQEQQQGRERSHDQQYGYDEVLRSIPDYIAALRGGNLLESGAMQALLGGLLYELGRRSGSDSSTTQQFIVPSTPNLLDRMRRHPPHLDRHPDRSHSHDRPDHNPRRPHPDQSRPHRDPLQLITPHLPPAVRQFIPQQTPPRQSPQGQQVKPPSTLKPSPQKPIPSVIPKIPPVIKQFGGPSHFGHRSVPTPKVPSSGPSGKKPDHKR
jgi:hypothetical protein